MVRSFLLALVDVAALGVIATVLLVAYLWQSTPRVDHLTAPDRIAQTTQILDRTGTVVLYEIHGEENRRVLPHDAIPDVMRAATIAAEDDAFYRHIGIDPFAIIRAVKENVLRGMRAQGGSTITQQLARNRYLSREKTWQRKVREAVLALKIERRYDKATILDAYLNTVPYGANAYGVQAAAQTYFGKAAAALTLDEAALLAALPKAPTTLSPYGSNTQRLIARQKMILERMRELRLAPSAAIDAALTVDTLAKVRPFRQPIIAPHVVFAAIAELERRLGRTDLARAGLRVRTTIDLTVQRAVQAALRQHLRTIGARFGARNAAAVVLDPRTGAILAMVGSADFYDASIAGQVNVALRSRQPGSAFKPIVYAAALQKGYQPETLLWDVPTNFGPDGSGRPYRPRNYDRRWHGLVSLRTALAQSLNVPAVKVLVLAGIPETVRLAQAMGLTTLTDPRQYGLALALGGAEVKLVELAGAYGVFAADGVRVPVTLLARVEDATGASLLDPMPPQRVLPAAIARNITAMLSDARACRPVFGASPALHLADRPVAVKTGTTQNYRDAWTIGYTPQRVVGVWVGNSDGTVLRAGAAGSLAAAPLWHVIMARVMRDQPVATFPAPPRASIATPMLGGTVPRRPGCVVGLHAKKRTRRACAPRIVAHSLLYYVNRDDPLHGRPNYRDPMFRRWEAAVQAALRQPSR